MSSIAIIGGGPAGLMAAERLAMAGHAVTVYDRMPSLGRKFLLAGRGGLNLTHSEKLEQFTARYGAAAAHMAPMINCFPPAALIAWCEELEQKTFVGSSGRVFPAAMKTSPLLRAWLQRLDRQGVAFKLQRRWLGWDAAGHLTFQNATGEAETAQPDAVLLALGGASWPGLGSDGGWVATLKQRGVAIAPLRPANVGFIVEWSPYFREHFAGQPLKPVSLSFGGGTQLGEAMITEQGLEGGAIYALSAALRDALAQGPVTLQIDLKPGLLPAALTQRLSAPRGRQSLGTFLRKTIGLAPAAISLLHEAGALPASAVELAARIKQCPIRLIAPCPIARAISTAGGIAFTELDDALMLKKMPGIFASGEMLDWEAPTGGYLLQACFSSGVAAADGITRWLAAR